MYRNNKSIIDILAKSNETTLGSEGVQLLNDAINAFKIASEKISLLCNFLEENSVFSEVENVEVSHKTNKQNANEELGVQSCKKDYYAADGSNLVTPNVELPRTTDNKQNLSAADKSGKDTLCLTQIESGNNNKTVFTSEEINSAANNSQLEQKVLGTDTPLKSNDCQMISKTKLSQVDLDKAELHKELLINVQKDNQTNSQENLFKSDSQVEQNVLGKDTPCQTPLKSKDCQMTSKTELSPVDLDKAELHKVLLIKDNQTNSQENLFKSDSHVEQNVLGKDTPCQTPLKSKDCQMVSMSKTIKSAADASQIELEKGTSKRRVLLTTPTNSHSLDQNITTKGNSLWYYDIEPKNWLQTPKRQATLSYHTGNQSHHTNDRTYHTNDRTYHTNDRTYHTNDRTYNSNDQTCNANDRTYNTNDRTYNTNDRTYNTNDRTYNANDRTCHSNDRTYNANDRTYHANDRTCHSNDRTYHTEDQSYYTKNRNYNSKTKCKVYFSINMRITKDDLLHGMSAAKISEDGYEIQYINYSAKSNQTSGCLVALNNKCYTTIMHHKNSIKIGPKHVKISKFLPKMKKSESNFR